LCYLLGMRRKTAYVGLYCDADLVKQLDEMADSQNRTRSNCVENILIQTLAEHQQSKKMVARETPAPYGTTEGHHEPERKTK
jgi:metal-responsive CopG/Arc/MetJ family transcriptional regulator